MAKKKGWEIDPSTVGSKEQLDDTKGFLGDKCGFCDKPLDMDPKAPLLQDFPLVVVRKNNYRPDKTGRVMYQIILKSHHSMQEVTPKEAAAIFEAKTWLAKHLEDQDPDWGGGFIHRVGNPKRQASSLPCTHYFESVVIPDGTEPVKETLCKSNTPEDQKRRKSRLK